MPKLEQMSIRLQCQHCGTRLRLRADLAGRRVRCPQPECRQEFTVPKPTESAPSQAAGNDLPAGQASAIGEKSPTSQAASSTPASAAPTPSAAPVASAARRDSKPATTASSAKKPARKPTPPSESVDDADEFETSFDSEFDDLIVPTKRSAAARSQQASRAGTGRGKAGSGKTARGSRALWIGSGAGLLLLVILGVWRPWSGGQNAAGPLLETTPVAHAAPSFDEIKPYFQKYCFDCHSGDEAEGGFAIDKLSEGADFVGQRRSWERVFKLIEIGAMPPPDVDQPAEDEQQKVVSWLDHRLFFVDCNQPRDPGRVTIRRLNRTEYNHTVRDLVGVDYEPGADFPTDDVGYGFDNIGDVLTVPPLLIEKYLTAAEEIASRAILTRDPQYISEAFAAREMRGEGSANNTGEGGKSFPSRGTISRNVNFPRAGEYIVTIDAAADQGGDELAKMKLAFNGKEAAIIEVHGSRERNEYAVTVPVTSDQRRVEISFINDYYEQGVADRNLYVYRVEIEGPLGLPEELPSSHQNLVAQIPSTEVTVADAARANLDRFMTRAFRRPVTADEVTPYIGFVEQAIARNDSFERGMQVAVQAVLISPQFLFRVEGGGQIAWNGRTEAISNYEIASRLSYFLWSSMPDEELLQLAREGKLQDEKILQRQVDRMLQDPRADALVANFAGQWLGLRKLATNEVAPDPETFPEFNDQLRADIQTETEMFFASVMRENRPITELLTGQYSFVNERLARLYGLEELQGDDFRRVDFKDGRRSGIVTHASVLTLTSYPDRTSPVKRGEWVLSNLLGDAPPEAPPVVPALDETRQAHPNLSLREQLVMHRADPGCASCHKVMDEIGFGLENFDPIGRWREQDGPHPIDSQGKLPSGESFSGPEELVRILSVREQEFARCMTEKMLTFALGRGLEYYDRCAVDGIVTNVRSNDYRFSALVQGIVTSEPFRLRRAR